MTDALALGARDHLPPKPELDVPLFSTLEAATIEDLRSLETLPPERIVEALGLDGLTPHEKAARLQHFVNHVENVRTDWERRARTEQRIPPGEWFLWVIMAGRGFGKTRTGAESTRERVENRQARRIALIGRTAGDVREVMVEGPSGILSVFPAHDRPKYEPSKRRITFGGTKGRGAVASTYSADEPDLLRGPEHDWVWGDEYASWAHIDDATDNMILGLRYGQDPRGVLTTTPRPRKRVREMVNDPHNVVTRGSTYRNLRNLAAPFADYIKRRFEGRRVGQQELLGILLDTVEGAIWESEWFERDGFRVPLLGNVPDLDRIVIGFDPATTSGEDADETGIVVAGVAYDETLGMDRGYVLHSEALHERPTTCMKRAVRLWHDYKADRIIFEANNGGDYLPDLLAQVDSRVPSDTVYATRGKRTRAEPVAGLYEPSAAAPRGRVHHVGDHTSHVLLEEQMRSWTGEPGEESPDVLDACVWALTYLMIDPDIVTHDEAGYDDVRLRGRR